jgi:hypothetical protein
MRKADTGKNAQECLWYLTLAATEVSGGRSGFSEREWVGQGANRGPGVRPTKHREK